MKTPIAFLRWLLLSGLLWCGAGHAQGTGQADFDHLRTGFPLSGAHRQARCESCHQNGIFKGTPRDCASCHVAGMRLSRGNVVMPLQHVPTSQACESCHNTRSFTGARFSHAGVRPGTCQSCHGGAYPGVTTKPNNAMHATVTGSCDGCHKSTANWSAARPDHSSFTAATNCASCHNGSTAGGRPGNHIPVGGANCFSCHGTATWVPSKWNHTQLTVATQCASCHTGAYPPADGRPANHIPYQTVPAAAGANCDTCHKAGYSSWAGARLHSFLSISTGCASCHNGAYLGATGKPANAMHATVTGNCERCHQSTSNWASARVDHSTFTAATTCTTCHNGSAATGKAATHIPVGATNCYSCHNTTTWLPSKWNHSQVTVTAQCASCHTGAYPPADGRPANHIPYQTVPAAAGANCDTCHKAGYSSWAGGRLHAYLSISTSCASCHSGAYLGATGKPATATHATVTGNCESCHKSTASWSAVTFAHSPANAVGTGTCDTCHNGATALGKPASHIPVPAGAARCDSCHRSQASFAQSVTMNHGVVTTAQCKSCHNGAYVSQGTQGALAKPTNHIPEAQLLNGAAMDCNGCHTGTVSWGAVTMNHNGSQGNGAGWCKACHQSGTSYLGSMEKKSLTHEKSTGVTDCSQSGCHRPLGTKGTAYRNWN